MLTGGDGCDEVEIVDALARASVAGTERLREVALETLRRAGVRPNEDPRILSRGLIYRVRPVIAAPIRRHVPRVVVVGKRIAYRAGREWGLNLLIGIATVRIAELGIIAGKDDRYRLAALLAMPDARSDLADDLDELLHVPRWFIVAHHDTRASKTTLRLVSAR
jgi:hypothetical protein